MKKITLLFSILFTIPIYAQWITQNSGVTANLYDVFCVNENIVIAVGNSGTILKTTDGGENWVQKSSNTTAGLGEVQFPTSLTGYAVGFGILLKTTDTGENWSALDFGGTTISSISCVNENVFFITVDGSLKKTIDGGVSFQTVNDAQPAEKIQFLTAQIGYGTTYENLLKTSDGGITWNVVTNGYVNSFFFVNENLGYVHTGTYGTLKTTDGGGNFLPLMSSYGQARDIFALNENTHWEVEENALLCGCPPSYCIINTNDEELIRNCNLGGNQQIPLYAIHFANETTGFVVGSGGVIYKNPTGTQEDDPGASAGVNEFKKDFIKIYPNPSSEIMTVAFAAHLGKPFSIEITDSFGKNVYSETYNSENAAVNIGSFSTGLYFLTVASDGKRQTQKVVVN